MSFNIFQYLFHHLPDQLFDFWESLHLSQYLLNHLFDILQFVSSLFIPFTMLLISSKITKTIERRKLDALKEKEWQVKWADMFLELAIEFNKHVSSAVCQIFLLLQKKEQSNDIEKLGKTLKRLSELDWHLKIYTQFSEKNGSEINEIQEEILTKMQDLRDRKIVHTDVFKDLQIKYNKIARKVHAEILEFGEKHNKKDYNNKII